MKPSLSKRLEELERTAGFLPAVHTIWDSGQDIEAAIAAMVAESKARTWDKFVAVAWKPPGKETDMHPEPFRDWPHRDTIPPAANDDRPEA